MIVSNMVAYQARWRTIQIVVLAVSSIFFQSEILAAKLLDSGEWKGGREIPSHLNATPYALQADSRKHVVRFSVQIQKVETKKSKLEVLLRSKKEGASIVMNDLGVNGDYIAHDGVYGASFEIDTAKIKPDSCLEYEAYTKIKGRAGVVSRPLLLCVSSFPVRVAKPNVRNPLILSDGVRAVADELILYAKPSTNVSTIRKIADRINAKVVGSIPPLNLYQLRLSTPVGASELQDMALMLNANAELAGASVNALASPSGHIDATTDPEFANQHGVQLVMKHPTLPGNYVWDAEAIGAGVTVIVADEGLDRTHPEFGTPGDCQVFGNNCGAVAVNDDNAAAGILQWHGTRVSGIIAAKANNAIGIAGVAHGSKILPYKITSYALTDLDQIFVDVGGLVISSGAAVINASFSGGPWSGVGYAAAVTALCSAVNGAITSGSGAIAVIAAGNNGADNWYYPARCNGHASVPVANRARVIVVGNSTSVDTTNCGSVGLEQRCAAKPSDPNLLGSNYGTWVDIMAPGSDIRTTTSGGYATSTGTSFSTPIVSGAVAILKSCGVGLDSIKSTLISGTAATVPYPSSGSPTTTPRIDVYGALSLVNHSSTGISLSNLSVNENTPTPTSLEIGTLTATDSDTCDKHTFTIVPQVGDDSASFNIVGNKLNFNAGVVLDREAKDHYTVTVHAVDFFGVTSADTTLNIAVNDVNEFSVGAVSDTDPAANSVVENSTGVVGVTAHAVDADATNNAITYSLFDSAGGLFAIDPSTGVVTAVGAINREAAPSYNIIVRATSADGSHSDQGFTIDVVDVNEYPVGAVSDSNAIANSVPENSSVGTSVGLTVHAVDADATNNTVTYTLTDDAGGRFVIEPGMDVVTVKGVLDYETTPGHSYSITVQAASSDGSVSSASFTIAISDVNEAPIANPDTVAATQDTPANYANTVLLGNDTDEDAGTTLTIQSVSNPVHGTVVLNGDNSVTFTPAAGYSGAASFSYIATDGALSSNPATVTVNVAAVNHPPVANNDTLTGTEDTPATYPASALLGNDTDPDAGTTLSIAGVFPGAGGTPVLNPDGSVSFMLNANFNGSANFTYTISDGALTSLPATVMVNVAAVNDSPTGAPVINGTRTVGQTLSTDTSGIADNDGLGTFHYQWLADNAPVGTDSPSFLITAGEFGKFMKVRVSYTDGGGTLETVESVADTTAIGDPHITTVDGLYYDFQGAGEFVALRGTKGTEVQLRMASVPTATPLTDPNSGLTCGVSVNTGLAARVGKHRVTYQAENGNAPVVRVDGVITALPPGGADLGDGGRVSSLGSGIQIDFPDQTVLIANASMWSYYNVWWLQVSVYHTPASEGIMGARRKGSWLPALSDGSALGPMPALLHDRYTDLYVKFADSWRVTDKTSLFDYVEGTSTATYTDKAWPVENVQPVVRNMLIGIPPARKIALNACRDVIGKNEKAGCVFDVMAMGQVEVAKGYLQHQKVRLGATEVLLRAVDMPTLKGEVVYTATVKRLAAEVKQERGKTAVPAGAVQFLLDGLPLGEPVRLDAKGQATLKLSRYKIGQRNVTARFVPARGSVFLPSTVRQAARVLKPTPARPQLRGIR